MCLGGVQEVSRRCLGGAASSCRRRCESGSSSTLRSSAASEGPSALDSCVSNDGPIKQWPGGVGGAERTRCLDDAHSLLPLRRPRLSRPRRVNSAFL